MAENAANFYSTTESQPSIFEIIAQKSLNVTLQPAIEKVSEFVANISPKYCRWLLKYYDETFLIVNGTLQWHYLSKHCASFSEYFYGLKRLRLDDYELSDKQKTYSWLSIVILPYIKKKFDDKLNEFKLEQADNALKNDFVGKLKRFLIAFQSVFELAWGSWVLINYLQYMSNGKQSQFPILHLLRIKLIYSQNEDDFLTFWSRLLGGKLSCSELSTGLIQNAVRSVLEISAFFVQFLQAWNAERTHFNVKALPVVEAPPLNTKAEFYKKLCPLCLSPWKSPMVLPVSGYVYCFSCIYQHLVEHGKCPVTNLPAKPLDLIRIYR